MATFERELKVSKTEGYELNVTSWLEGESITSLVVTDDSGLTTVGASLATDGLLSVLLTGLAVGNAVIHFNYSTATRSDCFKATVKVVDDC